MAAQIAESRHRFLGLVLAGEYVEVSVVNFIKSVLQPQLPQPLSQGVTVDSKGCSKSAQFDVAVRGGSLFEVLGIYVFRGAAALSRVLLGDGLQQHNIISFSVGYISRLNSA